MQLDLPMGPWTKIVSAQWGDYPLTVYQNPERLMLLSLFEKNGDKVKGVLLFLKKGFVIEGDPSRFMLSQRRDMILVTKFSREQSGKYLLLSSSPMYIDYNIDAMVKAVNAQYAELDNFSKATTEVLSGFDCKATDFKFVPEEKLSPLLGDPFSLFSFFSLSSTGMPGGMGPVKNSKWLLGIERNGDVTECKLSSMRMVHVAGGAERERLHCLHILSEAALLANVPVIVFDSKGAFSGLALPNKDPTNYEQFKMTSIPLGFPFKEFELEKGLFIDLSNLPAEVFLSCFYLDKCDIAPVIKKAYVEKVGSFSTLSDLIVAVSSMKDSQDITKYTITKAVRAIEVIQKSYPSVFAKNTTSDFSGSSGLGKVMHINLFGQPPELAELVTFSLTKPLSSTLTGNLRLLLVFEQDASKLSDPLLTFLSELSSRGVGVALQSEHDFDLMRAGKSLLKLDMVDMDAIVTEEGEKQKRVKIRPAYSHDSEL